MNQRLLKAQILSILPATVWCDVHVGVGLSGGADSTALLRTLVELKQEIGGRGELVALHVNHHLRGEDSDEDQNWCVALCERLGVRCLTLNGDVARTAQIDGDGLEAAARKVRYALFTSAAQAEGLRYIATAHTRDDHVETILFRLLRGTGLRGLAGMTITRLLTDGVTLVRPLLNCTRREVESYLQFLGQDFRTDESNASNRFMRNQIRNELLPLLRERYNAAIDDILLRVATQAAESNEYLRNSAASVLARTLIADPEQAVPNSLRLRLKQLREQPRAVVREVLRLAWQQAGLSEQGMTFGSWLELANLLNDDPRTTHLNLPGAVRARRIDDELRLEW